jgi:hypothetical protein
VWSQHLTTSPPHDALRVCRDKCRHIASPHVSSCRVAATVPSGMAHAAGPSCPPKPAAPSQRAPAIASAAAVACHWTAGSCWELRQLSPCYQGAQPRQCRASQQGASQVGTHKPLTDKQVHTPAASRHPNAATIGCARGTAEVAMSASADKRMPAACCRRDRRTRCSRLLHIHTP